MEKVYESLLKQATEVFGTRAKAKRWLSSYNKSLGTTPLAFLVSKKDESVVENILRNIKYELSQVEKLRLNREIT